jgi:hypothetical protein
LNAKKLRLFWLLPLLLLGGMRVAQAYSVLSHEEVVDQAWLHFIVPMIEQRYPGLTADQIRECHAYAYGGSVIQDIGYYPFGNKEFSDLLHYVRSGDFVTALLREASTPDEYAFALGALAHYYGDTIGHPVVNVLTGQEYPKLRSRFGRFVTYGDNETAHLRTEFGFDVVGVAHGAYSQDNYRDFIGFQVAEPVLARAFEATYGLPIEDVLTHEDLAITTYRYAVSSLIPKMTKVALAGYGDDVQHASPGVAKTQFIYRMRRTQFEQQYGHQYARPGFGARLLAFMLAIVPKVGPFSALKLHLPDADEQARFLEGFNQVEDTYRDRLRMLQYAPQVAPATLAELDFDTGAPTAEGEYKLADRSYAWLTTELSRQRNKSVTPALLDDLNRFYADPVAPDAVRKDHKLWARVQSSLVSLNNTTRGD